MKEKDIVTIFEKEVETIVKTTKTYGIPKWLANLIKLGVSISNYLPRK